jgi:glucose/arabinose dehydrogenase
MYSHPACRHLAIALVFAASTAGAATFPTNFSDQLVASGFNAPTAFAFLPDGRALVTEQTTGAIRMVVNGTTTGALATVPSLNTNDVERGLLSLAVDPGWPARPYVYMHYTQTDGTMRLVRYSGKGTLTGSGSTNLTLDSLYQILTLNDNVPQHNGGTLQFGPDGKLYFSVGDDGGSCVAQDRTSLRGCVFRLDVSGLPGGAGGPPPRSQISPSDNPWSGSSDSAERLVYAYGLRNPFRFQIDPATGLLYVADVGETQWEEMDEVGAGENEGWPWREGPVAWMTCSGTPPTFDPPIDAYDHNEGIVIVSAGVYRRAFHSTAWPGGYDGDVFYADYFLGFMRRLHKNAGTWQRIDPSGQVSNTPWATGLNTPVDFQWGPDGHLWWLSQNAGQLRRIVGSGSVGVDPPVEAARLALAASPNPARGRIDLGFDLPAAGRVRIGVFDLAGRRVVTLAEGWREAGHHTLNWDGRDASGRLAQAGIYVVRLDAGDASVTTRVTRLD